MEYKDFANMATARGLGAVSEEEYKNHIKFGAEAALRRIANMRQRAEDDAKKRVETWSGYPLGGRDHLFKRDGAFIDVSAAKTQMVPFLKDDGTFEELTVWGTWKGQMGIFSDVVLEITENQSGNTLYVNNTVREVHVKERRIDAARLRRLARTFDALTERDEYHYVILKGKMGNFDFEPTWEGSKKVGVYPINYNKVPCLNFILMDGRRQFMVRCQIPPTKNAAPYIHLPDYPFMEIQDTSLEEYEMTFRNLDVFVVGWLRRLEPQADRTYANVMVTAIVLDDEPSARYNRPKVDTGQTSIDVPVDTIGRADVTAPPAPGVTTPPPAYTNAADKAKKMRDAVAEVYEAVGVEGLNVDSFIKLKGNFGYDKSILEMAIDQHLKTRK